MAEVNAVVQRVSRNGKMLELKNSAGKDQWFHLSERVLSFISSRNININPSDTVTVQYEKKGKEYTIVRLSVKSNNRSNKGKNFNSYNNYKGQNVVGLRRGAAGHDAAVITASIIESLVSAGHFNKDDKIDPVEIENQAKVTYNELFDFILDVIDENKSDAVDSSVEEDDFGSGANEVEDTKEDF